MSGSAFRQAASVLVARHLSAAARSRILADVAIRGREHLIREGRASRSFTTTVDGREGAAESSVQPEGTIVYRFQLLGEAALFAMGYLRGRSPVKSGRFREGFVYAVGERGSKRGGAQAELYTTGRIIRPDSFDPQKVDADVGEILIFNRQPYSRKVDVQLVGNRRLRFSVPPDMFDDAAAAVQRRFPTLSARRIYQIRFPGQWVRKRGQGAGRAVESPALVISAR